MTNRLWVWVAVLSASQAMASQAIRLDLEQLTRSSDAIVIGKVSRVSSRWTKDQRLIVTEVAITVSERLKGGAEETVTVVQPGGVVGTVGQRVSGLPQFNKGDEVVLFLEQQSPRAFLVTGMAQGKFRVERSSDGRSVFAVPDDLAGLGLVEPGGLKPAGEPIGPMPLDTLRQRVQQTLRKAAPSP